MWSEIDEDNGTETERERVALAADSGGTDGRRTEKSLTRGGCQLD